MDSRGDNGGGCVDRRKVGDGMEGRTRCNTE